MRFFLTCLFLLCTLPVQAGTKDRLHALEEATAVMRAELQALKYEQQGLQQTAQNQSQHAVTLGTLEEQLRQLHGRTEELDHRLTTLDSNVNAVLATLLERVEILEKHSISSASTPDKPATTVDALVYNSAEDLYDLGYNAVKNKHFSQAQEAFDTFIATYPSHPLISNAYYWLAESHYAKADYSTAASYFLEGYTKQPNGIKASDNLLKLALSLGNQQKFQEACVTLHKLENDFSSLTISIKNRLGQALSTYDCAKY